MSLKALYDHVHKDGAPTPNTHDINTLLLLECAMALQALVAMGMESMEMNKAVLASLDKGDTEDFN